MYMCNIFRKRLEGKIHQVDDSGTSENERHKGWFFTLSLVMSVFISWNFQWNSIHLITHVINFLKAEKNGAYWRFWILIVLNSMLESKHLLLFFFFNFLCTWNCLDSICSREEGKVPVTSWTSLWGTVPVTTFPDTLMWV